MGNVDSASLWTGRGSRIIMVVGLSLLVLAAAFPPVMMQNQDGVGFATAERGFLLGLRPGHVPDYPRVMLESLVVVAIVAAALVTNHLLTRRSPADSQSRSTGHHDMPAESPRQHRAQRDIGQEQGDLAARRWPWRRVSLWTYNWYLLLTIWCFGIPLRVVAHWGQHSASLNSSADEILLLIRVLVAGVLLYFVMEVRRLVRRRIGEATDLLTTLLLGVMLLDGLEIVLALVSKGVVGTPAPAIAALMFHGGLMLCALPLRQPRFTVFGALMNQFVRHGVPRQFLAVASSPNQWRGPITLAPPYIYRGGDPSIRLSWGRLLRKVAVGHVTIPPVVEFGTANNTAGWKSDGGNARLTPAQ